MSAESIAQLRQWATDDRAQAEAKRKTVPGVADQVVALRYLAGLNPDETKKAQILAQAAELEQAGDADESAAATLDATAAGWDTVAQAAEDAVDDPNQH